MNADIFSDLPEGIQPTNVVEFYGVEGCGKTEMLIHLIASSILPKTWKDLALHGCEVSVIFIDTDYHFNLVRLIKVLEQRILKAIRIIQQSHGETNSKALSSYPEKYNDLNQFVKSCLDRLYIIRCNSSLELLASTASLEQLLAAKPGVSIIMIDSIGAFYWVDKSTFGESSNDQDRNQNRVVLLLSKYVKDFQLILIATKHAIFESSSFDKNSHREYLCPAWQRLVNYRYKFECFGGAHCSQPTFIAKRIFPKSSKSFKFSINDSGIKFDTR